MSQSKDRFFSIVAHDLRSTLLGLLGLTDYLISELDTLNKAEIGEYLDKIQQSANNTLTLPENLLNWSRLQAGKFEFNPSEFNISAAIEINISLLSSNAQNKNRVVVNNIDSSCFVYADQQMIHSVVLNLLSNAIKFSNPGGKVTFYSKIIKASDFLPNDNNPDFRNYLEISISDTGVGMTAGEMEKLFNAESHFTQVGTMNESGAGLGLLLVKEILDKHGSRLEVSSQPGKGAIFSFVIPLAVA